MVKYSSTDKRRVDNRTDRFKVKAFIKLSTDLKTKVLFQVCYLKFKKHDKIV